MSQGTGKESRSTNCDVSEASSHIDNYKAEESRQMNCCIVELGGRNQGYELMQREIISTSQCRAEERGV